MLLSCQCVKFLQLSSRLCLSPNSIVWVSYNTMANMVWYVPVPEKGMVYEGAGTVLMLEYSRLITPVLVYFLIWNASMFY